MLLPNLDFNPEFEGAQDANLLSLEHEKSTTDSSDKEMEMIRDQALLSLSQSSENGLPLGNWLHSRRMWVPKSHRQRLQEQREQESESDMLWYALDHQHEVLK